MGKLTTRAFDAKIEWDWNNTGIAYFSRMHCSPSLSDSRYIKLFTIYTYLNDYT